MRKRFLFGSGVVLLVILATLVIWQVSFKFEEYPESLNQTFIFWAVSTLVFVLTITLGFILFRTGMKLNYQAVEKALDVQLKEKLALQAEALAGRLETGEFPQNFCQEQKLVSA